MFDTMKHLLLFLSLFLITTGSLAAQGMPDPQVPQGENLKVPEGWKVRLDRPNSEVVIGDDAESADIFFVNMTPGWHLTTGPAGIFYHPASTVEGDFTLQATTYLFDTKGRNREGFGVFIGGSDLDGDNQRYIYFLLRNTGEYLIKERVGSETKLLQGWTKTDAMTMFTEETESTAQNDFVIDVKGDEVTFMLNGTALTTMPRSKVQPDGIFGLRVNHSVNLHISDLTLAK